MNDIHAVTDPSGVRFAVSGEVLLLKKPRSTWHDCFHDVLPVCPFCYEPIAFSFAPGVKPSTCPARISNTQYSWKKSIQEGRCNPHLMLIHSLELCSCPFRLLSSAFPPSKALSRCTQRKAFKDLTSRGILRNG